MDEALAISRRIPGDHVLWGEMAPKRRLRPWSADEGMPVCRAAATSGDDALSGRKASTMAAEVW